MDSENLMNMLYDILHALAALATVWFFVACYFAWRKIDWSTEEEIKTEYKDIDLYKQLHLQKSNYGTSGKQYINWFKGFLKAHKGIKTILDFGCGKGELARGLSLDIDEYDPAIEGKTTIPKKQYDLVITTDVLEHIHNDQIELLLYDIIELQPKYLVNAINTVEAINILPDDTNAHKTIENANWWKNTIEQYTGYKTKIFMETEDTCILCSYKD